MFDLKKKNGSVLEKITIVLQMSIGILQALLVINIFNVG